MEAGNDALQGGGDDPIAGGAGGDLMSGGWLGSDTVTYLSATGAVAVDPSTTDWQGTQGAGTDRLFLFENPSGS